MNLIKTKELYRHACQDSNDLHIITEEERIELQRHLVKIYKEIESVCVKHNLSVMLAYGSVLGAIRHGGFIPWDDDIDLFMPRKDYELFIHRYSVELPENLRVYAPNMNKKSISRFAKVVDVRTKFIEAEADDLNDPSQGVFVDIFPLESMKITPIVNRIRKWMSLMLLYIGSSVRQYELNYKSYKKLMASSKPARINYWLREIFGFCFSFWNYCKWYNIIDRFCRNDEATGYVADLIGVYKWQPIPSEVFLPPKKGTFEHISVYLPNDPVRHLELTYANWQDLPPEDERYQHYIRYLKLNKDS